DAGNRGTRPRALQRILLSVSRICRGRRWHDRAARFSPPSFISRGPHAHGVGWALLRRDHERVRGDVPVRLSGTAARPLGHHRLCSGAATEQAGTHWRFAGCRTRKIDGQLKMIETGETSLKFETLPLRLGVAGAVLLAICLVAGIADKVEFFRSYLVAFLFWIGITLGSLALLMVQHLRGGRWALVIRRILEAGTRTLPLMAVAALPVLAGMRTLYSWS